MGLLSKVILLRLNKKNKCVLGNRSENFREGRHTFFLIFFFWKKYKFMHLKGEMPFKMHKIIFFPRKPEKSLGFTSKFR